MFWGNPGDCDVVEPELLAVFAYESHCLKAF